MEKQLAFVLGGGGGRGALQAGALRALGEEGISPDLLVGTSVGAANAAFLAIHGIHLGSIEALAATWRAASRADLLPSSYLWLTTRTLFKRPAGDVRHRMGHFLIEHGLSPDLCFGDLHNIRLITVAADLNSGRTILYGLDPHDSILEGVLASTALPPWLDPIEKNGRYLIDGGVVSGLPIEPALAAGATEIIALDLCDPRTVASENHNFGSFLNKVLATVEHRQTELELALAAACRVPVRRIPLCGETPIPLWDFRSTESLLARGYEIARQEMSAWRREPKPGWSAWLESLLHKGQRASQVAKPAH